MYGDREVNALQKTTKENIENITLTAQVALLGNMQLMDKTQVNYETNEETLKIQKC